MRQAIISMAQCRFPQETSRALQLNLRAIHQCAPAYEAAHQKVFTDKGSPATGTPEFDEYKAAFRQEIETQDVDIDLKFVRMEDLNVEDNKLPLGIVLALDPIISDPVEQN